MKKYIYYCHYGPDTACFVNIHLSQRGASPQFYTHIALFRRKLSNDRLYIKRLKLLETYLEA